MLSSLLADLSAFACQGRNSDSSCQIDVEGHATAYRDCCNHQQVFFMFCVMAISKNGSSLFFVFPVIVRNWLHQLYRQTRLHNA